MGGSGRAGRGSNGGRRRGGANAALGSTAGGKTAGRTQPRRVHLLPPATWTVSRHQGQVVALFACASTNSFPRGTLASLNFPKLPYFPSLGAPLNDIERRTVKLYLGRPSDPAVCDR